MNAYISPNHFAGLVMMEEEHPLEEREAETGTRNIVVYHTAGLEETLNPLKDDETICEAISMGIYTFTVIEEREAKSWDKTYNRVIDTIEEMG
jgi:hypothetical protein